MPKSIQVTSSGGSYVITVNQYPDECPICGYACEVGPRSAYSNADDNHSGNHDRIEAIFRCPRETCGRLFIACYYAGKGQKTSATVLPLVRVYPRESKLKAFSQTIQDVSSSFCKIYNQALKAEDQGLDEIAGPGFRRALEFLIKDYLIRIHSEDEAEIKGQPSLQKLMNKYIEHPQLKTAAERAWWLGNDFTHYEKKWEGKDIQDLKKVIHITTNWVEIEIETRELAAEMAG